MPGPPRTPTKHLKYRGSWRGVARKDEPEYGDTIPTAPRWLDAEAKAEWNRVAPRMSAAGTLACVDRAVFAGYCQSWSDYYTAVKTVRRDGETFTTPSGYIAKNPWVTIKNEAWSRFNKAAAVLGLSASARSGMRVETPKAKSGKERFFKSS